MLCSLLKSKPVLRILEDATTETREIPLDEKVIHVPRDMTAAHALVIETDDGPLVYWTGWRPDPALGERGGSGLVCRYLSARLCQPGDEILVRDSGGGPLFWRATVL